MTADALAAALPQAQALVRAIESRLGASGVLSAQWCIGLGHDDQGEAVLCLGDCRITQGRELVPRIVGTRPVDTFFVERLTSGGDPGVDEHSFYRPMGAFPTFETALAFAVGLELLDVMG